MKPVGIHGELYLNDTFVGRVIVNTHDGSWHFGQFQPHDDFAPFAPLFGLWSLLMHADEDADRISSATSDELRQAELAIDRIHARLHLVETNEWKDLQQLNIDGDLIDWKV